GPRLSAGPVRHLTTPHRRCDLGRIPTSRVLQVFSVTGTFQRGLSHGKAGTGRNAVDHSRDQVFPLDIRSCGTHVISRNGRTSCSAPVDVRIRAESWLSASKLTPLEPARVSSQSIWATTGSEDVR